MSKRIVDFASPAVAFWSSRPGMTNSRRSLKTRRFASLSDAIRFLVEDKAERRFGYTIETDDADYSGADVDRLYEQPEFPRPPEPEKCCAPPGRDELR